MNFALFLGLALVAHVVTAKSVFERSGGTSDKENPIIPYNVEQKLDHFSKVDERKWTMRYLENENYHVTGGPIFIFIGGDGVYDARAIREGHIVDLAKEHKGILFYPEHRFYGKSQPFNDLSSDNLKYLDVKQALYDLAYFIEYQKSFYVTRESKVILVGGGYAGSLAVWFQHLFPGVVAGSWASSAPLLAKVNFFEHNELIGESIKLVGGEDCYNRIQNGIATLESLIDNNRSAEVKAMLKLCNNFNAASNLDVWTLFSEISALFYGDEAALQDTCEEIMSAEDDVAGLAKFILRRTLNEKTTCTDMSYGVLLNKFGDTRVAEGKSSIRQWMYQSCNDFGWFTTSHSLKQPFGSKFPAELFHAVCHDIFGPQFTPAVINKSISATNKLLGGLKPKVKNVYLTHGQLDPMRAMGIQDTKKATIIPQQVKCSDFDSISEKDHPEVKASKQRVAELVREWLR